MPTFDFAVETRREVTVAIADRLRYDKPAFEDKGDEESRKIVRMSLRFRDPHGGREDDITEWDERDLYGKGIGIPTIVRGVELAACRDAAYRFGGDCVYTLAFHAKSYNNRSTFVFKVPGGQEVQHLALAPGRGGPHGGREEVGIAERLMPDLLKYVSEKEARIEQKAELVFNTIMKQNQQYSDVVQGYTDRELKLREVALNAEDHQYERDKKRKQDEEDAKTKRESFEFLKEKVAPELLPHVIRAIQRFSGGPGGYANSPDFQAWYAEQKRTNGKAERPEEHANGRNGHGKPQPQGEGEDGPPAPDLGDLKIRVALDTARFVSLCRSRGKFEAVRDVLSEEQRALFDEVVAASEAPDLDEEEGVERITGLALMFGAAMQSDPLTGKKLLDLLDGISKLALVELSNLLEMYYKAAQSAGA
jgi:hypothetical protein